MIGTWTLSPHLCLVLHYEKDIHDTDFTTYYIMLWRQLFFFIYFSWFMFCFTQDPLDGWQGPAFQLQSVQDVESATIQVILPLEGHKCGDICLELNML